mmetsp:Transcript_78964/g.128017  ORF Transcript_78964/g.128017 Transcript_78964/m.128017 type:complete len:412 (+) Transcript_78964:111-1346(+)
MRLCPLLLLSAAGQCLAFLPVSLPPLVRLRGPERILRPGTPAFPSEARASLARPSLTMGVSADVSSVLKRYGVAAEDHEALSKELAPLFQRDMVAKKSRKVETLEVSIVRNAEGGLGIEVDKSNVIGGNRGQKELQIGDKVIAINGVPLGDKFVAQSLEAGKSSYVFTVERGGGGAAGSLETTLMALAGDEAMRLGDNGLVALDPISGASSAKFVSTVSSLEELGASISEDKMRGFWKLVWTNDVAFMKMGGVSGLGGLPDCYLAAHYQCYQDKDPTGQTVEIIGNRNLGSHAIAQMKGAFSVAAQQDTDTGVRRVVSEVYDSTKYQGSLLTSKLVKRACVVTYVTTALKVCRSGGEGDGGIYVYTRISQEDVGKAIQEWSEKGVPGVEVKKPKWEVDPPQTGSAASSLGN